MKISKYKRALGLFLLTSTALASTPAIAAESGASWLSSGLYISGKIGASTLGHTIERNTRGFAGLPVPDTGGVSLVENTDLSGGVAVGYQQNIFDDRLYVGLEGFFTLEDGSSRNINGVLVTDIDLNFTYGGRLIGGVNVTDKFSVYAHGGVTVLDFDVRNSYTFAPPVTRRSLTETAFSYGVGAAYKFTSAISVFAEYTQIADVKFGGIPEVAGGTGRVNPNELDLNTISLGFKYSF